MRISISILFSILVINLSGCGGGGGSSSTTTTTTTTYTYTVTTFAVALTTASLPLGGSDQRLVSLVSGGGVDYGGQPAQDHAKKIMTEFRAAGIKILSYFVDSYYDPAARMNSGMGRSFTYMYGKEAAFIDTANLGHLSKTLNELLERKG